MKYIGALVIVFLATTQLQSVDLGTYHFFDCINEHASHIGTAALKTVHEHPFIATLAAITLYFNRASIGEYTILSALLGSYLAASFAHFLLHEYQVKSECCSSFHTCHSCCYGS